MKKKFDRYPCEWCGYPAPNPSARDMHELTCGERGDVEVTFIPDGNAHGLPAPTTAKPKGRK